MRINLKEFESVMSKHEIVYWNVSPGEIKRTKRRISAHLKSHNIKEEIMTQLNEKAAIF